jgi:hypothetical protein
MTTPRGSLGSWLDRILIGAVGLIIVWFGGKLEMLNTTVQRLCETMAANGVEIRSANQRIDRLQFEQDALKTSYETNLREDRQKFYLVAKPRTAQTEEPVPGRH